MKSKTDNSEAKKYKIISIILAFTSLALVVNTYIIQRGVIDSSPANEINSVSDLSSGSTGQVSQYKDIVASSYQTYSKSIDDSVDEGGVQPIDSIKSALTADLYNRLKANTVPLDPVLCNQGGASSYIYTKHSETNDMYEELVSGYFSSQGVKSLANVTVDKNSGLISDITCTDQ